MNYGGSLLTDTIPPDWDDDENGDPDPFEEAAAECGRGQDYDGCTQAGTEYCDFECPFRDEELDEDDLDEEDD